MYEKENVVQKFVGEHCVNSFVDGSPNCQCIAAMHFDDFIQVNDKVNKLFDIIKWNLELNNFESSSNKTSWNTESYCDSAGNSYQPRTSSFLTAEDGVHILIGNEAARKVFLASKMSTNASNKWSSIIELARPDSWITCHLEDLRRKMRHIAVTTKKLYWRIDLSTYIKWLCTTFKWNFWMIWKVTSRLIKFSRWTWYNPRWHSGDEII